MAQRKTALSIDQIVFEEMDALAQKLKKTRSSIYELAARDFLIHQRDRRVTDQLNAVYGSGKSDADDTRLIRSFKSRYKQVVKENE